MTTNAKQDEAIALLERAYATTNYMKLRPFNENDVTTDGKVVIGADVFEQLVRRAEEGSRELLTPDEWAALNVSAKLANLMRKIIKEGGSDQEENDWAEAARTIHDLQHMILSQAAARAYPDHFRKLGGTLKPDA